MQKTRSVSAIIAGTVIDHIPAGTALTIMHLLRILTHQYSITLGLNLNSHRLSLKDLIKIEGRILNASERDQVALFAPKATVNVINNGVVAQKIKLKLPQQIHAVFPCPNPHCCTGFEMKYSHFFISEFHKKILLTCHYCEQRFEREQLKTSI